MFAQPIVLTPVLSSGDLKRKKQQESPAGARVTRDITAT